MSDKNKNGSPPVPGTGVNLGSGRKWKHPGWCALDELTGQVLTEDTILPFSDASLDNAYSSHFFEHVNDAVSERLFEEVYRVLRPGGYFRILVPDFELFHQKYLSNDLEFFRKLGFKGRREWRRHGVKPTLENIILHFMSNYDDGHEGSSGFYRGPPIVDIEDAIEKIKSLSTADLCGWIHQKIPTDKPGVKTGHINFWNHEKFEKMLSEKGFVNVLKMSHMNSNISDVVNSNSFDNHHGGRPLITLTIEAKK